MSGNSKISASPTILRFVAPLCFAASGSIARSMESGPSTIQPVILPSSFIFVSSAASTVTGIFGFTTSTAASGATFGHSIPHACATATVLLIISTLSSNVGYGINATSVRKNIFSKPSISNRHTCDKALPVLSPTSLLSTLFRNPFVSMRPFMYISASPSCTSLTAVRAASVGSFTSIISKPSKLISMLAAISLILSASPTRIASAISLSFAAFTASRTASSCATATASFFLLHDLICSSNPSKFFIVLFSSFPLPSSFYESLLFFTSKIAETVHKAIAINPIA